jgi:hypothetical protein
VGSAHRRSSLAAPAHPPAQAALRAQGLVAQAAAPELVTTCSAAVSWSAPASACLRISLRACRVQSAVDAPGVGDSGAPPREPAPHPSHLPRRLIVELFEYYGEHAHAAMLGRLGLA